MSLRDDRVPNIYIQRYHRIKACFLHSIIRNISIFFTIFLLLRCYILFRYLPGHHAVWVGKLPTLSSDSDECVTIVSGAFDTVAMVTHPKSEITLLFVGNISERKSVSGEAGNKERRFSKNKCVFSVSKMYPKPQVFAYIKYNETKLLLLYCSIHTLWKNNWISFVI